MLKWALSFDGVLCCYENERWVTTSDTYTMAKKSPKPQYGMIMIITVEKAHDHSRTGLRSEHYIIWSCNGNLKWHQFWRCPFLWAGCLSPSIICFVQMGTERFEKNIIPKKNQVTIWERRWLLLTYYLSALFWVLNWLSSGAVPGCEERGRGGLEAWFWGHILTNGKNFYSGNKFQCFIKCNAK